MSSPSGKIGTGRTYLNWTFRNIHSLLLVTSAYSPSQQVLPPTKKHCSFFLPEMIDSVQSVSLAYYIFTLHSVKPGESENIFICRILCARRKAAKCMSIRAAQKINNGQSAWITMMPALLYTALTSLSDRDRPCPLQGIRGRQMSAFKGLLKGRDNFILPSTKQHLPSLQTS
jgi:hypothetical protein